MTDEDAIGCVLAVAPTILLTLILAVLWLIYLKIGG